MWIYLEEGDGIRCSLAGSAEHLQLSLHDSRGGNVVYINGKTQLIQPIGSAVVKWIENAG